MTKSEEILLHLLERGETKFHTGQKHVTIIVGVIRGPEPILYSLWAHGWIESARGRYNPEASNVNQYRTVPRSGDSIWLTEAGRRRAEQVMRRPRRPRRHRS